MRDAFSSPVRPDLAHPVVDVTTQRRSVLAAEARHLSRRRAMALAVANRCRKIAEHAIAPEAAHIVSSRAMRRASILHVRFHHTLDALVSAGGFDEALNIIRDRKARTRVDSPAC
jgi:hypothetical protein